MATFTVRQLLPQSVDAAGISTATASTDVANPRTGSIYTPDALAAAAPIWFHRLPTGRYLALFAARLTDAVVADPQRASGPLLYSTATETTAPSWAIFDPTGGTATDIGLIPSHTTGTRRLTAAASRGNYLFILSQQGDQALLQHFRFDPKRPAPVLHAEEQVPGKLALGLYADRNDLWVFGAKSGKLALARKNWGRIGQNDSISPLYRWRFRTAKGWSSDVADLAPLAGDILAAGPISIAKLRDRFYLTVPAHTTNSWTAQAYTTRAIDAKWTKHSFTASLGDDASYVGGTVALQPDLTLTPGFTQTTTGHAQTTLDGGSDFIQVFNGLASQVVVLPATATAITPATTPATYRPYTIYSKVVVSDLRVTAADGKHITTIQPGQAAVLTPTGPAPTTATDWTVGTPTAKAPTPRAGFPYLTTRRLAVAQGRTLVTSWGAFEV